MRRRTISTRRCMSPASITNTSTSTSDHDTNLVNTRATRILPLVVPDVTNDTNGMRGWSPHVSSERWGNLLITSLRGTLRRNGRMDGCLLAPGGVRHPHRIRPRHRCRRAFLRRRGLLTNMALMQKVKCCRIICSLHPYHLFLSLSPLLRDEFMRGEVLGRIAMGDTMRMGCIPMCMLKSRAGCPPGLISLFVSHCMNVGSCSIHNLNRQRFLLNSPDVWQ